MAVNDDPKVKRQLFEQCFLELIGLEGGYVDHPADKGGETKYGISKKAYPNEDIKGMTLERAKELYKLDYWDKLRLDDMNTHLFQLELFEQAVNMGVDRAARHMQMGLKLLGKDVYIDGNIGDKTIEALHSLDAKLYMTYYKILNGLQFSFYLNIVTHNKTQDVFLVGWLKRVNFDWSKPTPAITVVPEG